MNQLSAANLGMLACNVTAISHTLGATAQNIAQQNQAVRRSAVAQSAATAALSLQAAAAREEVDQLAQALVLLALNAGELLDSLTARQLESTVRHNGQRAPDSVAVGPPSDDGNGRNDADTASSELVMTLALAEQTAMVARHMSDRMAALGATFERFNSHCAQIQGISETLCNDVAQLEVNDGELDKSKALITSLVQQIDVMVHPLRQIAVSCSGVTKNLMLTAEGLDIIRNKVFVRREDGIAQRDAG